MKNLHARVKKLEESIGRDLPPSVALLRSDGTYDYNGQIYENEVEFRKSLDEIFNGYPETEGPSVIILKLYR